MLIIQYLVKFADFLAYSGRHRKALVPGGGAGEGEACGDLGLTAN